MKVLLSAVALAILVGCGGSGSSSTPPAPKPPTTNSETVFTFIGVGNVSFFDSGYLVKYMADNIPSVQGWKSVNKVQLIGPNVTFQQVNAAIPKNIRTMSIVYIASHAGVNGVQVNGETVSWSDVVARSSANINGSVLFIVNTCDAGLIRNYINTSSTGGTTAALTICDGSQQVSTYTNGNEPVGFDQVIAECIRTKYDPNKDGILSLGELHSYTHDGMVKWMQQQPYHNFFLPAKAGDDNLPVIIY